MTSYTYGSTEGIFALQQAISAHHGLHRQHLAGSASAFANALETADFAGNTWGEQFFGEPVTRLNRWREHVYTHELALTTDQTLGLLEAMVVASDLYDDFARGWLGDMADAYGVDWV